jgi:hypothetical protein
MQTSEAYEVPAQLTDDLADIERAASASPENIRLANNLLTHHEIDAEIAHGAINESNRRFRAQ